MDDLLLTPKGGRSKTDELLLGYSSDTSPNKLDLSTVEGMSAIAEQLGYKKKEDFNALNSLSKLLNFDIARIAGAVKGAIDPNITIKQGIREGIEKNMGFADVIRYVYAPETRAGKILAGTVGFTADVLFSPLTYLTLGMGAGAKITTQLLGKTTGKVVASKKGTKILQKAEREIVESHEKKLINEGLSPDKANAVAVSTAKKTMNLLYDSIFKPVKLSKEEAEKLGKEFKVDVSKLSKEQIDDFIKKGITGGTLEEIQHMGTTLLDRGGIKLFSRTLISSDTIKKTPLGQAARRLGEHEISVAVKNTLARAFSSFREYPDVMSILDRGMMRQRRAAEILANGVNALFKAHKVTPAEDVTLRNIQYDEMSGMVQEFNKLFHERVDAYQKKYPDAPKLKDRTGIIKHMGAIEKYTEKRTLSILKKIDKLGKLDIKDYGTGELTKIQKQIDEIRKELKTTTPGIPKKARMVSEFISDDEYKNAVDFVLSRRKEKLLSTLEKLKKQLNDAKTNKVSVTEKDLGKGGKIKPSDNIEKIAILKKELDVIKKEAEEQLADLRKILNTRREIKQKMRNKKIDFGSPKLNAIAKVLWEDENSVAAKMAEVAGIEEIDAWKYYLPNKLKDQTKVKEFAYGGNLPSANLSFLKEFKAVKGELLDKKASQALKRAQIELATAKIQSRTIMSIVNNVGKPIKEFTEEEAKKLGFSKMSRTILGPRGKQKVEAWIPKEIHDKLNEFIEGRSNTINELAKWTGFDYITGIFKGYVTSPFPAFHIRNMTSNQFFLMIKLGVSVADINMQKKTWGVVLSQIFPKRKSKLLDDYIITKTGEKIKWKDLVEQIKKESDFLDMGQFSAQEMLIEGLDNAENWNPLSRNFVLLAKGRKLGTAIEAQSKLMGVASFVAEGKSVKEAIELTEEAIFNYGKLSNFEKDIMRRIIPFYTFARKNAEFQIRTLAKSPGAVAAQLKFIRGIGESFGEPITPEDEEGLPSWVIDSLGIKAGYNKYGQAQFFTGFGLPIEEFIQRFSGRKGFVWNTVSSIMSQMNPIIKFPIERTSGVDLFRGRPITEISNAGDLVPFLEALPDNVEKELKDLLQWNEQRVAIYANGKKVGERTRYTANPFALHWFRNLPTSRFQSTVSFMQDTAQTPLATALRLFTGVRAWSIDQEAQKFWNDYSEKKNLQDFLLRMGFSKKEILFERGKKEEENLLK